VWPAPLDRCPKYGVLWLCELAFLGNESKWLESADRQ
jgi:hypothetical protein